MTPSPAGVDPRAVLALLREREDELVGLVRALCELETPSTDPTTHGPAFALLARELEASGCRVRRVPGRASGGQLLAVPATRERGKPLQLLLGHIDTVWPVGTLAGMPVQIREGRLHGPGSFDMKGGLALAVHALRTLRAVGATPSVTPMLFVTSDEEVGSGESRRWIERLARTADRVWVLEPPYGPDGRLKTARKGVGGFTLTVHGRAAHAGLDPTAGASAIVEMAHQVLRLSTLAEPEAGVSVNVGVIAGGERTNVVPALCTAEIDVRVPGGTEAARIEAALGALTPVTPGTRLELSGGIDRPPLERTPANRAAWERARAAATSIGLELAEAAVGGASDGNLTSRLAPTLDGLGPVGDGAHANHEHIRVDSLVPRAALLALLLLEPPIRPEGGQA